MWDVDVPLQRSFQYPKWFRMFVVRIDIEPATPTSQQAITDRAKSVKGSVKAARAAQHNERRIQGSTPRWVANPWLDFVGWHRHLAGHPVRELIKST